MHNQVGSKLRSVQFITMKMLVLVVISFLVHMVNCETALSVSELRQKYGQENTAFNDGKSCNRLCDGIPKNCYYEFNVRMFDTMSKIACGSCSNGTIEDCFCDGCIAANGVKRVMMSINHQLPGPPINVCKGDRVIVDVTNHMDGQGLSIHWHGLFQKESPWNDGVPMLTQCPIAAGNTFRYNFTVDQSGTQIYHAHSGVHRMNGVAGIFNIRDIEDANAGFYDYDLPEDTIFLLDWNNILAEEKTPGFSSLSTFPESILINGFGSYFNKDENRSSYAPTAVFYVERGKRHRFRIVNVRSFNCQSDLSIKGHNLTVIAADGFSVEPIVVDSIMTAPGERIDFVLDATNDPKLSETILVTRLLGPCEFQRLQEVARIIFVDDINNYAKKIEDHVPIKDRPTFEMLDIPKIIVNDHDRSCNDPMNYCIAALQHKQLPHSHIENLRHVPAKEIPFNFRLQFSEDRSGNYITIREGVLIGIINGISYVSPPMPGLTQDDSEVAYCNEHTKPDSCRDSIICRCTHLVELEPCEVYDFVIRDYREKITRMTHPYHFHGYGFQVIDMGHKEHTQSGIGYFANATHLPVMKDTIPIPPAGFVRIRFRACNLGYWLMHCHFEFHASSGMKVIIKVGNRTNTPRAPDNFPKCGNFLTPEYSDHSSGNSIILKSSRIHSTINTAIVFTEWLIFVCILRLFFN